MPLRPRFLKVFLLLDPADIERVLVAESRFFVKPPWLRTPTVRRLLGDGLVTSDGKQWRQQRHMCQPAFHPRLLEAQGQVIAQRGQQAMKGWYPGQILNIQQEMSRLTLNIVGQAILGTDISAQADEISALMDALMTSFSRRHSAFGLVPRLPSKNERKAIRQLNHLVDSAISQAQPSPHSLISLLLSEEETRNSQDKKEVREQVKTFLAAGHESSALVLTWTFLLLSSHPDADKRLAEELDEVLGKRPPTPADLPRLTYCEAVLKEAMRLYPPLWMTGRTAVTACEIGGTRIPKGAALLTSPWAIHRHPKYFPAPDEFRPERWLSAETSDLPRFAFFPFGGGPRVCIGQGFAMVELLLVLSAISQRFRMQNVSETVSPPWATMTLRPAPGLKMCLQERFV